MRDRRPNDVVALLGRKGMGHYTDVLRPPSQFLFSSLNSTLKYLNEIRIRSYLSQIRTNVDHLYIRTG